MAELSLKDRAELKRLADRGRRAWVDIGKAAHGFDITQTTHLIMDALKAYTAEAAAIMETLKTAELEESRQVVLPLEGMEPVVGNAVVTLNGDEPEEVHVNE